MPRTTATTVGLTVLLAWATSVAVTAHVTVRPRESKPGAEERYTVRVPTEGEVATTSVRVDIPEGVTVLEVDQAEEAATETVEEGGRVVSITWRKEIKPKEAAEFTFRARNPAGQPEVVWKAFQHYADGTSTDWVGPTGDRRPASVTRIVPGDGPR